MPPFFSARRNAAKRSSSSSNNTADAVASPSVSLSSPAASAASAAACLSSPRLADHASCASTSPVSPFPPQLPPIPRVASNLDRGRNSSLLSPHHAARQPPALFTHDAPLPSPSSHAMQATPSPHDHGARRLPSPSPPAPAQHMSLQEQSSVRAEPPRPVTQPATQHLAPPALSPNYASHSRSQTSLLSGLSGLGEKLSGSSKSSTPSTPTSQPPKSTKSRLRNPMSLLLRRRSAQTLEALHDESLVTHRLPAAVAPIPDNYDPSIRGRIVHDFSAPRLNRNLSSYEIARAEPSASKIERQRTPVFIEHFDDDTSYEQSQAAIRAEQLADNAFLKRNSFVPDPPARTPPPPPSDEFLRKDSIFAEPPARAPPPPPQVDQSLPPLLPRPDVLPPRSPSQISYDHASSVLSPVQEAPSPTGVSAGVTPRKRKSTKTPPASRSRAASATDPSFIPAGLPKHLTSIASRFSFQIGGGESAAQEKAMEERHIQKAAEKASKSNARISTNSMGDDYDEYGMYDDFDMDGGYEEEIPMLGEEEEYGGGLADQTLSPGAASVDLSALSVHPAINLMGPFSIGRETSTLLNANDEHIGFDKPDNAVSEMELSTTVAYFQNAAATTDVSSLSLASSLMPEEFPHHNDAEPAKSNGFARTGLEDDMYFDDGLIEEQGEVDAAGFDEGVFDDPEGPLFHRKMKPRPVDSALALHPPEALHLETGYEADDDTLFKHLQVSEPSLVHKTSRAQPRSDRSLNAYHSALAEAAIRAEADGRFTRQASVGVRRSSPDAVDSSSINNSRPSLVPDNGWASQDTAALPPSDLDSFGMSSSFDDYDYSEYDSAMEDAIIAEANSEALANDYDGFYGQEFGFYAGPQGEAVNSYGGYFGQSGVGRSASGRNAMREPNLTPITERSEYSTRNSFISIRHLGDGANSITSPGFVGQSLTSPALAQLARISPYGWRDDEDMSLDALMRLRKGAFGSTSSLPAGSPAASPRNSSPIGLQFNPRTASPAGHRMREQNEDSFESDQSPAILDSLEESEEDDQEIVGGAEEDFDDEPFDDYGNYEDRADSPTLTASEYNCLSSPTTYPLAPPLPLMPLHSPPAIPPAGIALPVSPNQYPLESTSGLPFSSPSAIPLPASPPTQMFSAPPPLTLNLNLHSTFYPAPSTTSSPPLSSTTATKSSAPRRQSLGFISPISTTSPTTPGAPWRADHSRKGSAADSVTYVREHDDFGEGRWVLERRRTAETGELELVGREVVEGGRI